MDKIKYASYTQISPERDITASGFSRGQINFKMNMDSMGRWNPYRSYFRMRVSLTKVGGDPLDEADGIAPNMLQGDCFWQQMNAQCNGVKVSEIDDYVGQVSALRKRYSIGEGRRGEFLAHTNFAKASFIDRQQEIINEGYEVINSAVHQFKNLENNAGVSPLTTEELRVLGGDLTTIEYRQAADAGAGAVNLTQSVLKVGDKIRLNQAANLNFTANIIAIGANTIQVDRNMVAFAAEDILGNKLFYESIDVAASKESRRIKEYELCFKPSMGLFTIDKYLPGNWKIELTPHTNLKFQRYAIESLLDKVPDTDYALSVIDLQLYIWKGRASSVANSPEDYHFTEIRCQGQTITNSSLLNKAFVVKKESHTFSIAYQKPDAGDDTRFSKTKFRALNDNERQLQRYQLRINGETLPTPTPDIKYNADNSNQDFTTQQYYEQLHYNGTVFLDEPEGLQNWLERGPYYSYVLPKKLGAKSSRLYVSSEFRGALPENILLLVFDHYYKGFKLHIENGLVKKCEKSIMDS